MARSLPLQSLKAESTYEPPKIKPTTASIPTAVSAMRFFALMVSSTFPWGVGLHLSAVRSLCGFLTLLCPIGAQPQGDMRRLHRLPYHSHQFAVKCLQICLLSELRRECLKRLPGVVLPAIEPAVHESLHPPTQRDKQGCDHQSGSYDS